MNSKFKNYYEGTRAFIKLYLPELIALIVFTQIVILIMQSYGITQHFFISVGQKEIKKTLENNYIDTEQLIYKLRVGNDSLEVQNNKINNFIDRKEAEKK